MTAVVGFDRKTVRPSVAPLVKHFSNVSDASLTAFIGASQAPCSHNNSPTPFESFSALTPLSNNPRLGVSCFLELQNQSAFLEL